MDEEDQTIIFLSSLPKSYNHLVTTILYGKDTLKMEEVKTTLLANEARHKSNAGDSLMAKDSDQEKGCRKEKGIKKNHSSPSQEDGMTGATTTSKKVIERRIIPN